MTQPILPLIIYHDNCADGFGAAVAAYKKFGADGAEYLPMNYNDPRVKLEQIEFFDPVLRFPVSIAGRDVYILDFSFSPEIIDAMVIETATLTWIDHHKTAFEAFNFNATEPVHLNDFEMKLEIILDPNKSGCVLAWEHFHPNDEVPMLLKYIEDRDLWRWQYTDTRNLATGLRSKPFSFEWFNTASENLAAVIAKGAAMNELFDQQLADITKKHMVVMINGNLGRAVNCTPQFSSEAGNILAKQSGTFGMTWCVNDKGEVNVSLRSIGDYDVSAIAKTFGGGGHRNAAGLKISFNNLYFKDDMLTLTS